MIWGLDRDYVGIIFPSSLLATSKLGVLHERYGPCPDGEAVAPVETTHAMALVVQTWTHI